MHLFVCVCVHAASGVRSEDNVKRFSSLPFGYGDRTQVLRFGGKHLYQLSHASGPRALSHRHDCVGWWVWGGGDIIHPVPGIGLVIRLYS